MFGWIEFALIAVAVLVLFGSSRLPGLARGVGKAFKSYKLALRGDDDIKVRHIDGEEEKNQK